MCRYQNPKMFFWKNYAQQIGLSDFKSKNYSTMDIPYQQSQWLKYCLNILWKRVVGDSPKRIHDWRGNQEKRR